jgi:hypothetical protein
MQQKHTTMLPTVTIPLLNRNSIIWPQQSCAQTRGLEFQPCLTSSGLQWVAPENVGLQKNKSAIHLHVIPVMKCGCVFCELAKKEVGNTKR